MTSSIRSQKATLLSVHYSDNIYCSECVSYLSEEDIQDVIDEPWPSLETVSQAKLIMVCHHSEGKGGRE